jgi:hypothetical protein
MLKPAFNFFCTQLPFCKYSVKNNTKDRVSNQFSCFSTTFAFLQKICALLNLKPNPTHWKHFQSRSTTHWKHIEFKRIKFWLVWLPLHLRIRRVAMDDLDSDSLVSHGIIWYPLICFEAWYSYMIAFPGFRQYKCKVEKPLRWMSLQNAYVCQLELS